MPITLHKEQMEEMWLDSLLEHGDCFNLDYNNMHIFLSTSLTDDLSIASLSICEWEKIQ